MTGAAGIIFDRHLLDFFTAVLAHEMENAIGLRQRLIWTARTFQRGRILFGMFGRDMDSQSLCVEKLLLTGGTRVGQMALVALHMVVHRILVLLNLRTDGADKLASGVLLIRVRHLYWSTRPRSLQFLCGAMNDIFYRGQIYAILDRRFLTSSPR